jgi:hypothetical protein
MINLKVLEVMTSEERKNYVIEKMRTQGEEKYRNSLKNATRWRNFVDCSLTWCETELGEGYFRDLNEKVISACPELPNYEY